ncbi:MAG: T9SS type A sorting domain-containing protein [Bacteroidetes bacterium]|nr:T9SS type A sorting domain-containing protein [Bacteroidota bacterium]MBK9320617.1 T9SS type A sorting domain-containing protein [Bacteroidota bacterium]
MQRNNKSGIGYTYNGTDQQLIVFCNECTDENTQIEITDALGRLIHKSEFNGNRSTIIAEHFAKGYYFIKISSLKNVLTSKVLIY